MHVEHIADGRVFFEVLRDCRCTAVVGGDVGLPVVHDFALQGRDARIVQCFAQHAPDSDDILCRVGAAWFIVAVTVADRPLFGEGFGAVRVYDQHQRFRGDRFGGEQLRCRCDLVHVDVKGRAVFQLNGVAGGKIGRQNGVFARRHLGGVKGIQLEDLSLQLFTLEVDLLGNLFLWYVVDARQRDRRGQCGGGGDVRRVRAADLYRAEHRGAHAVAERAAVRRNGKEVFCDVIQKAAGTDLVQFIQCRKQQNAERRQRTENTQRILHGDAPRAARLRRLCRRAVARGNRGRQPVFFRQDAV